MPGATDGSNIIFTRSNINDSRAAVLQKLEDWQKDKLDILVMMTMLGCCHSKGFARLNRAKYLSDHVVVSIKNALDRQKFGTPLWAEAHFIACLLHPASFVCEVSNRCVAGRPEGFNANTLERRSGIIPA